MVVGKGKKRGTISKNGGKLKPSWAFVETNKTQLGFRRLFLGGHHTSQKCNAYLTATSFPIPTKMPFLPFCLSLAA
jgi:hypothetical protein